jgi:predicted TIM-barrel fold metal-dependent hydrolase
MAVPGEPYDDPIKPFYADLAATLPPGAAWFDVHTHVGSNDPDGFRCTADEVVACLDRAGHAQALVFAMQEPDGYPAANDRVLADAEASAGRLRALCRLDPHADPMPEARRCLAAGAVGVKLHPRAERFQLSEPAVEEIVALAGERRLPVMVHAGRGIPALGRDAVALARRHPDARIVLAHAGISDLSWIWAEARVLPNLFFDTSWWNVADLTALFATVAPGQIVYGSDIPYGSGIWSGLIALRLAASVGLTPEVTAEIVGGQLRRLLAGEDPADLGPPPGPPDRPPWLAAARALTHLEGAISRTFGGTDPSEPLALARLACEVPVDDPQEPLLRAVRSLTERAEAAVAADAGRAATAFPVLAASLLAGTPGVGVPAV